MHDIEGIGVDVVGEEEMIEFCWERYPLTDLEVDSLVLFIFMSAKIKSNYKIKEREKREREKRIR